MKTLLILLKNNHTSHQWVQALWLLILFNNHIILANWLKNFFNMKHMFIVFVVINRTLCCQTSTPVFHHGCTYAIRYNVLTCCSFNAYLPFSTWCYTGQNYVPCDTVLTELYLCMIFLTFHFSWHTALNDSGCWWVVKNHSNQR